METHISIVRHYETTLQLGKASRKNIICCSEKIVIYKVNK